jgi:hypothetical protein
VAPLCMARNVINDHCEFEIGLKRMIGPKGKKAFCSKDRTTHHHAPPCTTHLLLHANRAQIAASMAIDFLFYFDHVVARGF